jgi:hypothetical protein
LFGRAGWIAWGSGGGVLFFVCSDWGDKELMTSGCWEFVRLWSGETRSEPATGTAIGLPQPGQVIVVPALSSEMVTVSLHAGQRNRISMTVSTSRLKQFDLFLHQVFLWMFGLLSGPSLLRERFVFNGAVASARACLDESAAAYELLIRRMPFRLS